MELKTKEDFETAMYTAACEYVEAYNKSHRLRAKAVGEGAAKDAEEANKMWISALDKATDDKLYEDMQKMGEESDG